MFTVFCRETIKGVWEVKRPYFDVYRHVVRAGPEREGWISLEDMIDTSTQNFSSKKREF